MSAAAVMNSNFAESPRVRRNRLSSRSLLDDLLMGPEGIKRIEELEGQIAEQDSNLADLDLALNNMRETCRLDREEKQKELDDIQKDIDKYEETLSSGTRNMDARSPLHEYMNAVKKSSTIADSTYLLKLESMLLKCLHQMGVLESQLRMAKSGCDYQMKVGRDEMKKVTDERSSMEVQYLNRIVLLDTEIHSIRMKYRAALGESPDGAEGGVPYLGWKQQKDADDSGNTWSFLSRQGSTSKGGSKQELFGSSGQLDSRPKYKRRSSSTSDKRSFIGKGA